MRRTAASREWLCACTPGWEPSTRRRPASRVGLCPCPIRSLAVAVVIGLLAGLTPAASRSATARDPSPAIPARTPDIEDYFDLFVKEQTAASGYTQSSEDAPAAVTVITGEEIQRMGYRSLADVLGSVRSFYITDDRQSPFLGVRGFSVPGDYNSRVLLLIDGERDNDSQLGSADVGFGGVDLHDIVRIEIARGSISSVYGSNAFFGVVNLVTRRGSERNEVAAAAELGSTPAQRIWVGAGNALGDDLEWNVSAAGGVDEGDRLYFSRAFREINGGFAVNRDRLAHVTTRGRARWGALSLHGHFGRSRDHAPTAPFFSIYNRESYVDQSAAGVSLSFEHGRPQETLFTVRLGWRWDARPERYQYDNNSREDVTQERTWEDHTNAKEVTALISLAKTWLDDHTLSAGIEYRNAYDQLISGGPVYEGDDNDLQTNEPATTQYAGAYAQAESRWVDDRLLLSAGVRLDYHLTTSPHAPDTDYFALNPRMGIIAKPMVGTVLKAIYGTAFRAPNAYELHYFRFAEPALQSGFGVTVVPLRPERIRSAELLIEQAVAGHLLVSISGYYYALADMITFVLYDSFEDTGGYFNTDEGNGLGLEGGLQGAWSNGLSFRASYTIQRARSGGKGAELTTLPNSPTHMAKASITAPMVANRHFVSAEVIGLSARLNAYDEAVPGHAVVNLGLLLTDIADFSVSASVKNLLDTRFKVPASDDFAQSVHRGLGRTLWLEVRYRYPL